MDLKQFAVRRGYAAAGVKLALEDIGALTGPVLVYLETPDFRHFAILRGVREDRVFLADPSRGNIRMSVEQFEKEWPGVVLALGKSDYEPLADHDLCVTQDGGFRNELTAVRFALDRRQTGPSRVLSGF